MWEAVSKITSGFAVVAFAIAAITAFLRRRLLSRERQLMATPPRDRASVVQAINDTPLIPSLPVDPSHLSPEQQYSLLLEQIRHSARRFYILCAAAVAVGIGSVVVIVSSNQRLATNPDRSAEQGSESSTVTTAAITAIPACGISASPGAIPHGESTRLMWSSTDATRVEIAPDVGIVATNGQVEVRPQSTTTYTITARNSGTAYARAAVTACRRNRSTRRSQGGGRLNYGLARYD
jgi:hypothetical protein